jgi:predicted phage-related endonuclease
MNELNELIKQRMELKKQVDVLEESKKEVENRIKLMIELENINEYEDDSGNYLTYKEIVTNRLDKKLVEQNLAPELFKECFSESKSMRLTIVSPEERQRRKSFKG